MTRYFREISVSIALGFVLLGMAIFAPAFFQPQPLLSLLTREAPTLVVACGMALVIITRQIDISVGSQFSVCSVCAGLLAAMNWPMALVVPASIGIGAMLRAVNGADIETRTVQVAVEAPPPLWLSWSATQAPGVRPDLLPLQPFQFHVVALGPPGGVQAYEFAVDLPACVIVSVARRIRSTCGAKRTTIGSPERAPSRSGSAPPRPIASCAGSGAHAAAMARKYASTRFCSVPNEA